MFIQRGKRRKTCVIQSCLGTCRRIALLLSRDNLIHLLGIPTVLTEFASFLFHKTKIRQAFFQCRKLQKHPFQPQYLVQSWILWASKWVDCPPRGNRRSCFVNRLPWKVIQKDGFTFLSAYQGKTCHCMLFLFSSACQLYLRDGTTPLFSNLCYSEWCDIL